MLLVRLVCLGRIFCDLESLAFQLCIIITSTIPFHKIIKTNMTKGSWPIWIKVIDEICLIQSHLSLGPIQPSVEILDNLLS